MREDEDQFRHYMPVLRRIIILVAVLTAIPVVMWTITAFVRTYVGPPKTPTFRLVAGAPAGASSQQTAVVPAAPTQDSAASPATASSSATPSAIDEAKATTTDSVGGMPPPMNADSATAASADASSPGAMPADTAPAPGISASSEPPSNKADMAAASNSADGGAQAPNSAMQFADQQPTGANWSAPSAAADALPPGEPIAGPVPLPRKRPSSFAVAEAGIPLPVPRPDAAGPRAADAPATPLNWLHNILQPSATPSAAPAENDSGGGDYQETPH